jgi:hypothetical protein
VYASASVCWWAAPVCALLMLSPMLLLTLSPMLSLTLSLALRESTLEYWWTAPAWV